MMTKDVFRCFGSAGLCFLGATGLKRPPVPQVDMEQPPVPPKSNIYIWHMNKTELLSEATRCGLAVSSTWNRDEIRSIIAEHRAAEKGNTDQAIKGMGSMTLEQLNPLPDDESSTVWSMVQRISDPGLASRTPLPPQKLSGSEAQGKDARVQGDQDGTPRTAGGTHQVEHGEAHTNGGRCRSGSVGGDRGPGSETGDLEKGARIGGQETLNTYETYFNDSVISTEGHYDLGGDPKNHDEKYNMGGDSMNPPLRPPECAGGDPERRGDYYDENRFEMEEVYGEDENDYHICVDDHFQRNRQPVFWQLYTGNGEMVKAMEEKGLPGRMLRAARMGLRKKDRSSFPPGAPRCALDGPAACAVGCGRDGLYNTRCISVWSTDSTGSRRGGEKQRSWSILGNSRDGLHRP